MFNLSLGVALHKWAESFTLGVALYKNKVNF